MTDSHPAKTVLEHTPGPWKVCQGSVFTRYYVKAVGATYVVAECGICEGKTGEANARLIAAAPELLQALKDLGDWLAYGLNKSEGAEPTAEDHAACARVAARARAAVDKAEGRA